MEIKLETEIVCEKCGRDLAAEHEVDTYDDLETLYKEEGWPFVVVWTNHKIKAVPCEYCLSEAKDEGYNQRVE